MLALLLSLACFLPLPGTAQMGEECSESRDCAGDGTCLKGVCAGYACDADTGGGGGEDCADDHECASVAGVEACAIPCDADADCPGSMSCSPWDDGDYCI